MFFIDPSATIISNVSPKRHKENTLGILHKGVPGKMFKCAAVHKGRMFTAVLYNLLAHHRPPILSGRLMNCLNGFYENIQEVTGMGL